MQVLYVQVDFFKKKKTIVLLSKKEQSSQKGVREVRGKETTKITLKRTSQVLPSGPNFLPTTLTGGLKVRDHSSALEGR